MPATVSPLLMATGRGVTSGKCQVEGSVLTHTPPARGHVEATSRGCPLFPDSLFHLQSCIWILNETHGKVSPTHMTNLSQRNPKVAFKHTHISGKLPIMNRNGHRGRRGRGSPGPQLRDLCVPWTDSALLIHYSGACGTINEAGFNKGKEVWLNRGAGVNKGYSRNPTISPTIYEKIGRL